jgi:hypothetical protein
MNHQVRPRRWALRVVRHRLPAFPRSGIRRPGQAHQTGAAPGTEGVAALAWCIARRTAGGAGAALGASGGDAPGGIAGAMRGCLRRDWHGFGCRDRLGGGPGAPARRRHGPDPSRAPDPRSAWSRPPRGSTGLCRRCICSCWCSCGDRPRDRRRACGPSAGTALHTGNSSATRPPRWTRAAGCIRRSRGH